MAAYMGQFPYAMSTNRFLACDEVKRGKHEFCVCGVPYDGAVTNRPGARFGPTAVRQASLMLCDGIHPEWDLAPNEYIGDALDMMLPNAGSCNEVRAAIEKEAIELMKDFHCVFLGGDHSVTLALLRALKQAKYPDTPIAMIHFDAHCDAWADHFGEPSGHGTWTKEALDEELVSAEHTVQIGIRSSGERSAREFVSDRGGIIYSAKSLRGRDGFTLEPMIAEIKDRLGDMPVYLTLDIDCLDPAFAPGTGTPEPGGLTSSQVLTFLEELSASLNFVGMDCVEVAPAYDQAELTSNAAATFVWTYLCGRVFANKKKKQEN